MWPAWLGLAWLLTAAGCEDVSARSMSQPAAARAATPPEPPAATMASRGSPDPPRTRVVPRAIPEGSLRRADPGFLGKPEGTIRDRLRHMPIAKVSHGGGGRSVAFRLVLKDGTRGYFKPAQTVTSAQWHAELMAWYLDRALGMGRVPPVVGRRVPWARLEPELKEPERADEVQVAEDGRVRGAFIWWLPKPPVPLQTRWGWERWIRVEPWKPAFISPFQRPRSYVAALNARHHGRYVPAAVHGEAMPAARAPEDPERAAALSDMILLDYLVDNVDRWGGDNGNVLTLGEGGPLVYLDNGAGFAPGPARRSFMEDRLRAVQRFRGRTLQRLRSLDLRALRRRVDRDPVAPVLAEGHWQRLARRRARVLRYVDRLIERFGEEHVVSW